MFYPSFLTLSFIKFYIAVPVGSLVFVLKAQQVHHLMHHHRLAEARISKFDDRLSSADFSLGATDIRLFYFLKEHVLRRIIVQLLFIYPPDTSLAVELTNDFLNQIRLVLACNMRLSFLLKPRQIY